jgi:hypothetical protein
MLFKREVSFKLTLTLYHLLIIISRNQTGPDRKATQQNMITEKWTKVPLVVVDSYEDGPCAR